MNLILRISLETTQLTDKECRMEFKLEKNIWIIMAGKTGGKSGKGFGKLIGSKRLNRTGKDIILGILKFMFNCCWGILTDTL